MTLFITLCALLVALAVVLLVYPLLRSASADPQAAPQAYIAATVVAALLPLVAFAAYFWASNWSWDAGRHAAPTGAADIQQMVGQLQERLSRQPDDLEGWKLLGRSAVVLGDFPLAREAFGKAFTMSQGRDPDAMVGYAEALVAIDEREIDGQAADLFEQALQLDPDNARALWYGGIIAYRRGDIPLARERWVELQNHELPPDLRQIVAERLAELAKTQGEPPAAGTPAPGAAAPAGIQLSIGVAPALAAQVPVDATLFVIARRGESGPPIAVVRRPIGSWPVNVTMTDADTMMPGMTLAGDGPLRLIARISRAGQPAAASGDLFGEVGYDFAAARPVQVTIDRVVP